MIGTRTPLVGRTTELERLASAGERAEEGSGGVVLLCGEAGIGKSRLAAAAADEAGTVLRGAATEGSAVPYGPIVDALRSRLRSDPQALGECGPLLPHLALLLPELGEPAAETERATIFEAIRCAFAHLAGEQPLTILLDDLQWSDETTLELLAALAGPLQQMPVLVIGAYRSDGLPRGHRLRWLRNELRRGGRLEEISLDPLDRDGVAALLEALLPEPPSPALVRTVHDRTLGSPFFVAELVAALQLRGALRPGRHGLELADADDVPLPDTVREAVLVGTSTLSDEARAAAEAAAVAGQQLDLDLVAGLSSAAGLAELIENGLLEERGPGRAAFRHALAQEALYAEVPWMRRRELHRRLAEALGAADGSSFEVATHWLGAADEAAARGALVEAARRSAELQAHRDAARAAGEALELWPEDEAGELRLETLERFALSSQLAGEMAEAAKGWRELASGCHARGDGLGYAQAQRHLAGVQDLLGERDAAFASRRLAAEAFATADLSTEAALERLAMADHHRRGGRYREAIELAEVAVAEATAAGRDDLRARLLGLQGVAEAKGGDYEGGLASVRAGLALALEKDLIPVAAELYQRLSLVLYDGADYRQAEEALDTALDLCRTDGSGDTEVACVTCLVYVLRERGEWPRAEELGRELIESDTAVWVAEGLIGAIHAFQGKLTSARRLLTSSRAVSSSVGHYNMYVDSTTGLAIVAAAEGLDDEASRCCRELLARWERSEDHHYAVWGIRWAATYLAGRGDRDGLAACTEALSRMATDGGHPDALAALAQALGELALLEGETETAAEHMSRAVELHRALAIPHERAQIELRAGVALAAAGEREEALERLSDAYRCARKLGAGPLASRAAQEVAALGESVAQRLGSRAAAAADGGAQLTRRELEVLRHVAVGRTNKEIAQELFISQRTVDMHVRNLLGKLDCRSRVEASHRAGELGLLDA
ncbi:MAG TPA: AAA family ATPase [Solirubrobacterales bacterium]|nr:AAA family ATPase [Solirubrobacterales bacterium]